MPSRRAWRLPTSPTFADGLASRAGARRDPERLAGRELRVAARSNTRAQPDSLGADRLEPRGRLAFGVDRIVSPQGSPRVEASESRDGLVETGFRRVGGFDERVERGFCVGRLLLELRECEGSAGLESVEVGADVAVQAAEVGRLVGPAARDEHERERGGVGMSRLLGFLAYHHQRERLVGATRLEQRQRERAGRVRVYPLVRGPLRTPQVQRSRQGVRIADVHEDLRRAGCGAGSRPAPSPSRTPAG